jgi:hypothetical protein
MKKISGWLAFVIVLVGALYLWLQYSRPDPQALSPIDMAPAPAAQNGPKIRYPIPVDEQAAKQLPALEESDQTMWEAMTALLGRKTLKDLFHSKEIVRHIVVTIDNLPRKTVATHLLPTKPVSGRFLATGKGEGLAIAPKNAARYTPFVRAAEMIDTKQLVQTYIRLYPLFQRAYQDLGYPKGYFNDRLVDVIDDLIDTPEIEGPVRLEQPHVVYRFADPDLEAESAGHKIMIRMGSENAARVKTKLREIRQELTGQALKQ